MAKFKIPVLIVVLGSLFFIPFLGGVHLFDWDEANFAEISREMIETNDYLQVQVNYRPFFEKPPLFFWIQVLSMKVFGINEFGARFPNAIIGIVTLLVLFNIGKRLYDQRFGMLWALAYFGSILPHMYFKSGIIDPLFNLLIFLGIYYFLKFKWKKDQLQKIELKKSKYYYLLVSGLFIGLAMLTKGPVAFLILMLTFGVYLIIHKFKLFIKIPQFVLFCLIALSVVLVWFGLEAIKNGPEFMIEFVVYQVRLFSTADAGHAGFPGFHVFVLLIGCFPASIFAIRGFYRITPKETYQIDFRKWMLILFWVVLGLFTIVQSKIVHYSSLCYFPLTFLAAFTLNEMLNGNVKFNTWMKIGIGTIGGLLVIIASFAPVIGRNIEWVRPFLKNNVDGLATLDTQVNWTGWEAIPGIMIILVLVMFFIFIKRENIRNAFYTLFLGTAITVFAGLIFYIGRIEMYTQNSYVEFCKTLEGKDGYVKTSGFKSYLHLFYSKRKPPIHEKSDDIGWLTWEEVDKDVYFIGKKHVEEYWKNVHTVEQIGSKNGYVFFKRKTE